jgi:O-antigen ligase
MKRLTSGQPDLVRDLGYEGCVIAAGLLFYLGTPAPVAVVGLVAFALLSMFRLDLGLLAVVFFVPFFFREEHLFGHTFPVDEALLGTVLVLSLSVHAVARFVDLRVRRPAWTFAFDTSYRVPGIIFILAGGVAVVFALQPHLAAREYLEVVIEPAIFFCLLLALAGRSQRQRHQTVEVAAAVVVLTGVVAATIALGQYVTGQHLTAISDRFYSRAPGPYPSADNLGLLLDRVIPLTAAIAIFAVRRRIRLRSAGRLLLYASGAALLILSASILFTFTLGAWIACISVVGAMTLWAWRRLRSGLIGLACAIVVALVCLATPFGQSFIHAHGITGGRRIEIWTSSVHMLEGHWLVGIGPDNFRHYYIPRKQAGMHCHPGLGYIDTSKGSTAWREACSISHPHDELLDFWLSTGIVGLLAFAAMTVTFVRNIVALRPTVDTAPIVVGCLGAMAAGLIHGVVDNAYFLIDLSLLTWLLFGMQELSTRTNWRAE